MKTHLIIALTALSPMLSDATPASLKAMRAEARLIVKKSHCASCHTPGATARDLALKVFNLDHAAWSSSMNDDQLRRLRWALKDATEEEIREMGVNPNGKKLSPKEVVALTKFVDSELRFRRLRPNQRFEDIEREKNPGFYGVLDSTNGNTGDCTL